MNERIKELAEQASRQSPDGYPVTIPYSKDFAEVFAKLIVRECIDVGIAQKKWVENQEVFDPRDKDWNLARIQQSQRIVDKIREHFGVE